MKYRLAKFFSIFFVILSTNLVAIDFLDTELKKHCSDNWFFKSKECKILVSNIREMAEKGDPVQQYKFAQMYIDGIGLKEDKSEGIAWFRKAAMQGYTPAKYYLAHFLFVGIGIERDTEQAMYWYHEAAEEEYSEAEFALGYTYFYGTDVPVDREKGMYYMNRAAEHGNLGAQTQLAYIFDVENDETAISLYMQAAKQGNALAQYNLGVIYAKGNLVAKDIIKAYVLFMLSEINGQVQADYNRKVLAKKIPRKNLQILQVAIQQHLKKYPPNQNVGWDPSIGESLFE